MLDGTKAKEGLSLGGGACASEDAFAAWRAERDMYHPDSFAYRQITEVLADLGDAEALCPPVGRPEPDGEAPPGFAAVEELELAVVAARQFYKRVPVLYDPKAVHECPAVELTTDLGHRLRLVDLRGVLNGSLHDIAPTPVDQERLDIHLFRDLGVLARTGQPRRSVRSVHGPALAFYSAVIHTKLRAYFLPVATQNLSGDGRRVMARIGDCGNADGKETALYRRLFGRTLRLS